ncbi:PTPA-CTERM sorting domain-containing protein [Nodosilinea nodulosa]|uniref:PTPA-CTERM sorting domain-containing protein n=1 Tax=Nodosilinea nodulosa TaxID=416001 RepID=UPI00031960A8|nr:PTPA-CTERM sorting domain-containing protein [Nodosilinea nodulosa]
MKERLVSTGFVLGTAVILGGVWLSPAQAFSLGSSVTVTNSIRDVNTQQETVFVDPLNPQTVTVGAGLELEQFGGIWNIDLNNNSILFSVNSRFGNVTSGDDIYRFLTPDFGGPGQNSLTGFTFVPLGNLGFDQNPAITVLANNWLEVVFPLGFTDQDLTKLSGQDLAFRIDLTVEPPTPIPSPVPTPALLPGLVGLGLAVLSKKREGDSADYSDG